ncbi:hypothetical protein LCGC14_2145130 [marine sediment metagenome]|uniref:Transposase IS204/IS1001/IS1096/IS1165 DDE domain-containing protein n=1 Tax=marine sediment metagenome TaxID=412755 RepID=A0A0F9DXJ5_9ZZZZ
MGVENFENGCRSLLTVRKKAPINPYLITCDFSPALIAAIKVIFPESAVQIDGFHVMQELNNGIRRDFKHYRAKHYRDEINELLGLRSYLNDLQEERKHADLLTPESIPPLKKIISSHSGAKTCREVIKQFLFLLNTQDPHSFFMIFDVKLNKLLKKYGEIVKEFCDTLRSKFPKRKFTIKGRNRVQGELLKKLKTLCLKCRKPLKEEAREFSKKQFLLFKQPEKVSPKAKTLIEEFLKQHPTLKEYREMTLMIGEIYRESYNLVDGRQIDALTQKKNYSNKLNTAIATLKKYKSEIIAFRRVFLEHPELGKTCRANLEWLIKRVKAPFKASLNRQSLDHIVNRLQLQLGCEVRNFIS